MLDAAEVIEAVTALTVVRPADLLLSQHAAQHRPDYSARVLLETSLELGHPTVVPSVSDLQPFTDHASRERTADLRAVLVDVAARVAHGGRLWTIESTDIGVVAIAATTVSDDGLCVEMLRARSNVDQLTFSRQLAHILRDHARSRHLEYVSVAGKLPTYVERALTSEGYTHTERGLRARLVDAVHSDSDGLIELIGALELGPTEVSEAERRFWPLKLITGGVPAYVVPIQPRWARGLFGVDQQPSLIPRDDRLGLAREHVYYISYRDLDAPARLLWFVTGGGPTGGVVGHSWLDDVVHGRPRTLFRRFGSQGVYAVQDIETHVHRPKAKASALVFSRTELFDHPIRPKQACVIHPAIARANYLQTTRPIDEHVFGTFCRRSNNTMTDQTRRLLLSVRPRFAEAILSGAKTVELRRTRPVISVPTEALIYASSPVRCLVGRCKVLTVAGDRPARIWRRFGDRTSISRCEFDEYYGNAETAYALEIAGATRLHEPITLEHIRRSWRGFHPPQSFRYVTTSESDELLARAS